MSSGLLGASYCSILTRSRYYHKVEFHFHVCFQLALAEGYYDTSFNAEKKSGACACKICGKVFQTSQGLKYHMASHTGTSAYTCSICGFGCSSTTQLEGHTNKHRGIKPHKCPLCPAAYGYSYALKQHQKSHNHYYQKDIPW